MLTGCVAALLLSPAIPVPLSTQVIGSASAVPGLLPSLLFVVELPARWSAFLCHPPLTWRLMWSFIMRSIIQILKVNEMKKGVSRKTGNPYEMQDAECLILNDDGSVDQVGVLPLPKDLREKVLPGTYVGSFAMRPDMQTRRIGAVLTGLQPYTPAKPVAPASVAPKVL